MKTLWILVAAAAFAACHSRSEDQMGAAPDRGDTSTVKSGYDTTMARPAPTPAPSPAPSPSTGGYDTTAAPPADSAGTPQ